MLDNKGSTLGNKLVFIVNVDWYFRLHWVERAIYFKSLGYDIHIVGGFYDLEIKNELTSQGFTCHHIPIRRKSIGLIKELSCILRLKAIIKSINPVLIHCITVKPNVYGGILNRTLFRKPIVFGITGLGAIYSSKSVRFTLLKFLVTSFYKFISIRCSRIIFENGDDYQLFSELGILKYNNGIVIKGAGIDLDHFSPSTPIYGRKVLFAARLLRDKGLDVLIEAKTILKERGVDFELNVAGIIDNDVSSAIPLYEIKRWERKGLINWLGNVNDMPRLIKDNDIVCLPTVYGEGVPRILIEAASCQRAIIATDVPGCREIVSHGVNGLLSNPGDAISLADSLQELLESPKLARIFGVNGRKKVEDEFSQQIVFDKTKLVYETLISK
ncbi:glycosyltransferase family 4 protein [Vibrio splendidus]|uniref:Glycosyl transferase n=1 Tax=Vibrio splendidus TaxID=29497 RepID=A0A2N7JJ43_VIBSP|nr:glycosyltransferase family 4 protein [Vibrio splendidus]PMM40239.1 glycosyl transferase [Vibrio splendidus]